VLLPFASLLGFQVNFRCGSMLKVDRDVNRAGDALKPDSKVPTNNDHTWAEVTLFPAAETFLVDGSGNMINIPVDLPLSRNGRYSHMQIALPFMDTSLTIPKCIFNRKFITKKNIREFWPKTKVFRNDVKTKND